MVSAQTKEFLANLQANPRYRLLLEELAKAQILDEKPRRWAPENRISQKERIFYDGLQTGREQVLSIFRGDSLL